MDKVELGIGNCGDEEFDPFLARLTYYSTRLMKLIALYDLHYLKSNKTIYYTNINRAPTVFVDDLPYPGATERYLYIYYTNIRDEDQTYIIKPGTLTYSLTGTHGEIHCVDALQLYSSSGKGTLFDINDAYSVCADPGGYANQFEIQGERPAFTDYTACPTDIPTGAMCVTVPPFSCGYFVFAYSPYFREGFVTDIYSIYPNPSSTYFVIQQINDENLEISDMTVELYNLYGSLIQTSHVSEGQRIDISEMPVGVYTVLIKTAGMQTESETLIKMK